MKVEIYGQIVDFPDGTPPGEIQAVIDSLAPQSQAETDQQLANLFGETAAPQAQADPSLGDYARAGALAFEGAVTGIPRTLIGGVEGVTTALTSDAPNAYARGREGREAYDRRFQNWATPQTQGSQQVMQGVQENLAPLEYAAAPFAGVLPQAAMYSNLLRGRPIDAGAPQAPPRMRQVDPSALRDAGIEQLRTAGVPLRTAGNAGAARTSNDAQRAVVTSQLPIPLRGDSAPTLGQLTRDPVVVRREIELRKNDDLGGPLRARKQSQNEVLNQNLDYQVEKFEAQNVADRDIGRAATAALEQRRSDQYGKVNAAYADARAAGELEAPATLPKLDDIILQTEQMESLAPNARPILNEARRLGVIDDMGVSQSVPLDTLETFRQFVVKASDPAVPRENAFRKQWLKTVDQTIDRAGVGEKFRTARRLHSQWVQEFQETPITANILATKRGTNERRVAFEDVFKKTLLDGSVDEINKLRGSLLRSGEGQQSWFDLKARLASELVNRARTSAVDSNEQPIISYYQLQKNINALDKSGKLESLFGKKGAEELRNLTESVRILQQAPPDAQNFSGTAAEGFNMMMRVVKGAAAVKFPYAKRLVNSIETGTMKKQVDDSLNLDSRPDLKAYTTAYQDILEGR